MNELEDTRMGLGKAINDGEGLLASKEAELLRLREEERALEDKDVASDHDLDSTA
jgi:kinetochore protein Spc24, fungi type